MARHSPTDTRYSFAALVAGLIIGAVVAAGLVLAGLPIPVCLGLGAALGVFVMASVKYTDQWEKAVLMRLGRYRGLRGPGYFTVIPILDRVSYHIDQRIRTTAFGAESCLTRDTVPVNVDAIAFWIVRDAEGNNRGQECQLASGRIGPLDDQGLNRAYHNGDDRRAAGVKHRIAKAWQESTPRKQLLIKA